MKTEGDKTQSVPAGVASAGPFLRSKSASTSLKLISEAFAQEKPVVVVTAPEGAGTTRLLQEWQIEQDDDTQVTVVAHPSSEPDDVLKQVAAAYGLDESADKRAALVSGLRKHLLALRDTGISCVLVLDDADELSVEAIELFKMLASGKHKKRTLLRVILVGRPILLQALRVSERPNDATEIAFVSLPPFEAHECLTLFSDSVALQLGKKVKVAPDAADAVFEATGGLPGAIVALAHKLKHALGGELPKSIGLDHIVGLEGADTEDSKGGAADLNNLKDASKLPKSIRESEDQQALLRFALSQRPNASEEKDAATIVAAEATKPAKNRQPPVPPSDMPEDLSNALAQMAEAEKATVREGGKVQALPPQRQEGRPPPMKLDSPIGAAGRKSGALKKQSASETKAFSAPSDDQKSLDSSEADQFEFRTDENARSPDDPVAQGAPRHSATDGLPDPKPRPKVSRSKRVAAKAATAGEQQNSGPKVYDQSELREILRSFDAEPEPEKKRRSYIPLLAGAAAVAAMFAAYPFVLGPDGVSPIGEGAVQTAEVPVPSLPRDPDGTMALPDVSVLADWEQKKDLEIARVKGPGPATSVAILRQPKTLATPVQDIEAVARPDPVRLSARSNKPDVRPVRVNPLQSGDATSLASSIALQATDNELANTLRLKEVAEREIAGLINQLSGLRSEVKSLRSERDELAEGLPGAREEFEALDAQIASKRAALETEQQALNAIVAERQTISAELEKQSADLSQQQELIAALRQEDAVLQTMLQDARSASAELEETLNTQQQSVAALAQDLAAGRSEQSELAKLLEQGRIELSALDEQTEDRIATLSDLQDSLKLARVERDELATAKTDLTAQNTAVQDRLGVVTASLLAAESALTDAQLGKDALESSLIEDTRAATETLAELTEQNQSLGAEIARLEAEVETAQSAKIAAQSDSDALKAESQSLAQTLDLARAQVQEIENRRAEAEQQLAGLLPQVENAQNALAQSQQDLQNRADEVDGDLASALAELATIETQKQGYETELAQLSGQIDQAKNTRESLTEELVALSTTRDRVSNEKSLFESDLARVQQELDISRQALAGAKSDRENTLAQLTQDTNAADARLAQLQSQNAGLIRQTVDLTAAIEAAQTEKAQVGELIASLQKQSDALADGVEQSRLEMESLTDQRDQASAELASLSQEIDTALGAQATAEKAASLRLAAIASETEALLQTKDAVTADIADLSTQAQKAAEQEGVASAVLGDLNEKIAESRAAAGEAEQNLSELEAELRTARADLDALLGEAGQVETEIADLRNMQDSESLRLAQIEGELEIARKNALIAGELKRLQSLQTDAGALALVETLDEESVAEIASRFGNQADDWKLERKPSSLAALAISIERPEIGEAAPRPVAALPTREAAVVSAALDRAPGLTKLSGQEREALRVELINGTCIPDALRKITGTINRQTLRALIRRMDRCPS